MPSGFFAEGLEIVLLEYLHISDYPDAAEIVLNVLVMPVRILFDFNFRDLDYFLKYFREIIQIPSCPS